MASQEAADGIVIDKRTVGQPLDGPALGAGIAERVPRWQQVRTLFLKLVFEAAEGALPWMARSSLRPARSSVMASNRAGSPVSAKIAAAPTGVSRRSW
jgi:hypothetical protein